MRLWTNDQFSACVQPKTSPDSSRIEGLLARLQRPTLPREWPLLRAVWALEKIGTPEAWKRLEELARGGAGVVVTRAAKEALARRRKGKS